MKFEFLNLNDRLHFLSISVVATCDTTVRTVDRFTVDRYTLYILHCLIAHTHTLSTPHIYCTLYVLCTLSVHLSQTSLLFATHVHILVH